AAAEPARAALAGVRAEGGERRRDAVRADEIRFDAPVDRGALRAIGLETVSLPARRADPEDVGRRRGLGGPPGRRLVLEVVRRLEQVEPWRTAAGAMVDRQEDVRGIVRGIRPALLLGRPVGQLTLRRADDRNGGRIRAARGDLVGRRAPNL